MSVNFEFSTAAIQSGADGAFTEPELRAAPAWRELVANDPIMELLLTGQATTAREAERKFLTDNVELITQQVIELVTGNLSEDELSLHPLTLLLRGHGSRHWEDSLL
ncbi:MAG: hypothetical protein ACREEM_15625 [Blastocatellia bacterium]